VAYAVVKKLRLHNAKACGVYVHGRYASAVAKKLKLHDAKACGVFMSLAAP